MFVPMRDDARHELEVLASVAVEVLTGVMVSVVLSAAMEIPVRRGISDKTIVR